VSELPLHQGEVALTERVPAADTDPSTEVGQVGAALNRLLGHVEGALAARHDSETQVRQFVADASHELRTPLASIRGYAELVRRMPDAVPSDALRAMERVESESRRMTTLVEDMLLLARLDAGRPLDSSPVDVVALAVDAVADAHAAGPDHAWRLELPGHPDSDSDDDDEVDDLHLASAEVVGDEDRLRQVLVNLLANARVHTPAGTTVVTSVRRDGDTVSVRVQDDGPGIPAPLASQLFHRFTRGDAARSPGSGSSGLGLAIVDAVVRAHAGTITVDGTPGRTAFTVALPAAGPVRMHAGLSGASVAT
jgi:two-component system OmpR family sensor kinase